MKRYYWCQINWSLHLLPVSTYLFCACGCWWQYFLLGRMIYLVFEFYFLTPLEKYRLQTCNNLNTSWKYDPLLVDDMAWGIKRMSHVTGYPRYILYHGESYGRLDTKFSILNEQLVPGKVCIPMTLLTINNCSLELLLYF